MSIYALSSREGLAAKLGDNPERLKACGSPVLESALVKFLTAEKLQVFLVQTCDRFERLLVLQDRAAVESLACRLHDLRANLSSALGICSAYPQVLLGIVSELREFCRAEAVSSHMCRSVERILPDRSHCKICEVSSEEERRAIADAVSQAIDPELRRKKGNPVVCLADLAAVLEEMPDARNCRRMAPGMASVYEQIADSMQLYALKRQSIRRDLLAEEESHAFVLGIALLAGHASTPPRGIR